MGPCSTRDRGSRRIGEKWLGNNTQFIKSELHMSNSDRLLNMWGMAVHSHAKGKIRDVTGFDLKIDLTLTPYSQRSIGAYALHGLRP